MVLGGRLFCWLETSILPSTCLALVTVCGPKLLADFGTNWLKCAMKSLSPQFAQTCGHSATRGKSATQDFDKSMPFVGDCCRRTMERPLEGDGPEKTGQRPGCFLTCLRVTTTKQGE